MAGSDPISPKESSVEVESKKLKCNDDKNKLMDSGPKLGSDLIVEIMARLPPTSLRGFQSTSEEFGEIISTPYFREKYKDSCPKPEKYLYSKRSQENTATNRSQRRRRRSDPDQESSEDGIGYTLSLMGSCDGLILFRTRFGPVKYSIRNPAIGRVLELPARRRKTFGSSFSYVPSTGNYRVVSLYYVRKSKEIGFEVLTPGVTKTWRIFKFPDLVKTRGIKQFDRFSLVTVGEMAYCIRTVIDTNDLLIEELVCFDLGTKQFVVVSLPKDTIFDWKTVPVFGWDEKLAFGNVVGENLHVIVLEDCKKQQWGQMKIIQLPFVKKLGDFGVGDLAPLSAKKDELWFWLEGKKIFTYSIGTGVIRDIRTLNAFASRTNFDTYKPSVVTIDGMKPDPIAESDLYLRWLSK